MIITNDKIAENFEKTKEIAIKLSNNSSTDISSIFDTTNLEEIEKGVKQLNTLSNQCWLLSAIAIYSLIYDREIYKQSGLDFLDYKRQSRERLGLDTRDFYEQISSARFFIKHHDLLVKAGWTPQGNSRKLARAETALELSGSLEDTIYHVANDTWLDFKDWYSSFKANRALPFNKPSKDITFFKDKVCVGGKTAVIISDEISSEEQSLYRNYINQIFQAIKDGYEPAIIPCFDEKEALEITRFRDKQRRERTKNKR